MPAAAREIDANGLVAIPGAVDVHVHFREPGYTHKEDWLSGTRAAAAGGVTTVLEMPNTNPATSTVAALKDKIALASAKAVVDFGVYGNIASDNRDEIAPMIEAGAASFKIYMGSENPVVPAPDDDAILAALETLARHRMRATAHAENVSLLAVRGRRLRQAGRTDPSAHLEHHIDLAEVEAIGRIALYARWVDCPVHIAHVSSRHSLPVIERAKADGTDLSAETCPHYITLSTADAQRLGASYLRVKPPVRGPDHPAPLRGALFEGLIDVLSTDHAPHRPQEKRFPVIWDNAVGFPGVETSMRILLTAVAAGELALERYVEISSSAPARLFGLAPRKGAIEVGADADIVLVDLEKRSTIRGSTLHSKGNATPFEGMETVGLPVFTLVRGNVVMKNGTVTGAAGLGRRVLRDIASA
jgi:dihydroorotase